MNLKRLALLVLLGVLVGITIFWVPGRFADSSSGAGGGGSADATSSQSGSPGASANSETGSGSGSGSQPESDSDPEPATEALPQAASTPTTSASGLPGLSGKPRTQAALISEPLPKQAVRKGSLVAGYPAVLAPSSRTRVDVSSVSPTKGVLQVALTASCPRPCDVLRHFRTRLTQHGFEEVETTSVENAPAMSLRRGEETVNVAVTRTSRRSVEFALLAVLHTKT